MRLGRPIAQEEVDEPRVTKEKEDGPQRARNRAVKCRAPRRARRELGVPLSQGAPDEGRGGG